jgi:flagellar export protein FliJ
MKRYSFSLERVLDWKTLVAEQEQLALQTLNRKQDEITASLLNLNDRITDLSQDTQTAVSGHDLAYSAHARSALLRHKTRTQQEHAKGETKIVSQQLKFRAAETERKLMDKLKGRSFDEWSAAVDRDADATASDLYLGTWNRR